MDKRIARPLLRRGAASAGGGGALAYKRPPVKSFTDACEAPYPMWKGAIPTRRSLVRRPDGTSFISEVKTYEHPPEVAPSKLSFANINGMYCMGNDDLVSYFQEGVPGKVGQLFPPTHPRGFLYRKQSHLLNCFVDKVPHYTSKKETLAALTAGRPGLVFDGATGTGKSALMTQALHFARSRGIFTIFVPNARDWTHGEWAWPSTVLPGFWDAPDATRNFFAYLAKSERKALAEWPLRVTPKTLPCESSEQHPTTLLGLCEWAVAVPAPASVDRQSVAIKYFMDEIMAETSKPILFVVDGINLFAGDTHFRFPHPDFFRTMNDLSQTDVDMHPVELPRIPAARFTFMRALNRMMLEPLPNRHFVTATTRDFKQHDGGVTSFPDPVKDPNVNKLDEYAPFDVEKDTILHPMEVGDFDEYEYRSFLRFLINSGELAGLGWGPLWHYSPDFERKLYKIEFMSERNPQRVVDHYHQELVWKTEYSRIRLKQHRQPNFEVQRRPLGVPGYLLDQPGQNVGVDVRPVG
jgi:small subunit ribosomal protein S29